MLKIEEKQTQIEHLVYDRLWKHLADIERGNDLLSTRTGQVFVVAAGASSLITGAKVFQTEQLTFAVQIAASIAICMTAVTMFLAYRVWSPYGSSFPGTTNIESLHQDFINNNPDEAWMLLIKELASVVDSNAKLNELRALAYRNFLIAAGVQVVIAAFSLLPIGG